MKEKFKLHQNSVAKRFFLWFLLGCSILTFSLVVSITLGSVETSFVQVLGFLKNQLFEPGLNHGVTEFIIVWHIRIPRALLAVFTGIGLSVAGVGFQGALRNPLAEPYLLGVSSGCALGAVIIIVLGVHELAGPWTMPLSAFASGLFCLWIVFRIASLGRRMRVESLILSGVILNAFLGAVLSLTLILKKENQSEILFWLMGSLSLKGWPLVWALLPYVVVGVLCIWFYAKSLNLMALGDDHAFHTGLDVSRHRRNILIISSFITAACVSVSGTIGFVGLIVPHMIRLLTGPDHRLLIPVSALAGGVLVLWADNLARLAISPEELPLGVITAFVGVPFFVFVMWRNGHRGEGL